MFAHVYVQVHACNQSMLYYAFGIKLLHQTCVCAYENVFLFMSVCVYVCECVCTCVCACVCVSLNEFENKQNTPDRVFMFAHVYVQV